jgi:chemotaxis protein CheD
VGIGEIRVAGPPEHLAVYGIGSCVVIFLHDPDACRGGLAHPLLPGPPPPLATVSARSRYVSAAVRVLCRELGTRTGRAPRLAAKIIGGATMFGTGEEEGGDSIGQRNLVAARAALDDLGIPLLAWETGGTCGRSLIADPATGRLEVWHLGSQTRIL